MVQPPAADSQWPARIDAVARQADLGEHRGSHRWTLIWNRPLILALILLGGAAIGLVSVGAPAAAILATIPAVVIGGGYALHAAANRGARLDIFERGITVVQRGKLRVVRYDDTALWQNIVDYHHTLGSQRRYSYRLRDTSGAKFTITGNFQQPTEWGPTIQRAVTDAQLPVAWAAIMAGQRLEFGRIWVTAQQVGTGTSGWPWSRVSDITVTNGTVNVRSEERPKLLVYEAVRQIPNFFVFLALTERLRAARPIS
ncbi:DUF6585 family protein [Mycobacterium talmoniae]|nr:DUF6585 family protein [Mycobacterium talmoniae]PQM46534.1 hypothetical protein C1Y40_03304 [Mycobacterium talmoniae]